MLNTNVDMAVDAWDFYFGGPGDFVGGITVTPLGEQYVAFDPATSTYGLADIPGESAGEMGVIDFSLFPGNTSELGLMLFTNGDRGEGARGGATQDTEALFFAVPNAIQPGVNGAGVLGQDFSSSQTLFMPMVGR